MVFKRPVFVASVLASVLVAGVVSATQDQPRAKSARQILQSGVETRAFWPQVSIGAVRPKLREANLPATRWTSQPGSALWNRAALSALKTHGRALADLVPADIADWCPLYPDATMEQRRAFWLGFMSALAKFESTYRPQAVGGGGRWYGLLQILPATARGYQCNVGTGTALKNGAANLSCAVRIMAVTVPRDGVIYGRGGRGVAADWGPMRSRAKRNDMSAWLKGQSYCTPVAATRPALRPVRIASD